MMKKFIALPFLFMVAWAPLNGQTVKVVDYEGMNDRLTQNEDTVYLINFWATWCKPCVEELPAFLRLEKELKDKPFKMILVSLDFSTQIDRRVKPFLEKQEITTEVLLLDDPDANSWINKVSPDWDGSIPATWILAPGKEEFYEQSFTYEQLANIVKPKIKQK